MRTQRQLESPREDRGELMDRVEARREAESDWLDSCDQTDAATYEDDEALPRRRRLRTHGDLVYEVALSVEIGRRLEGKVALPRRSHPSIWVSDSRLFGFRDPLPERRARALEVDGALRAHRLQDAFRELPRSGFAAFSAAVVEACDRRDLRDVGGLSVAAAEALGRVRYGPPLDAAFSASGTDPVLLSAAAAVLGRVSDERSVAAGLDRAAQSAALRHVDACVRDPYGAAVVERAWAREREGLGLEELDPGGANFEAWFEQTRAVAQVHYAVGLDPLRDPLPTSAVEAVLASGGSLADGVRAVGGAGEGCHRTARAVHGGFAVVRRLESWMVADEAALARVMAPVLEHAGARWPPADRALVVEHCGLGPGAPAVRPAGPVAETAPAAADLFDGGRPFAGAVWPAGGVRRLAMPAVQALAVHGWRRRAGVRADVFWDEAEAVQQGGRVGPGVVGVVVPGLRGDDAGPVFPVEALGVAVPARADAGIASVDQLVHGLGVRVALDGPGAAAYRLRDDRVVVPREWSPGPAYASAVALAAAAATGHRSREGRRDTGACRDSIGWVREQIRCDLAAAKLVGALGLRYEPPAGVPLPAEARQVFVRHAADLCRDADRMASFVIARGRAAELPAGYRAAWEPAAVEPPLRSAAVREPARDR